MPLSQKPVEAINRAVQILRELARGSNSIGVLSSKTGLSKSTVHRIIKSLEMNGFVAQDPINRNYFLGPGIIAIASVPLIAHQYLIFCAADELNHLRTHANETVNLQIRIGTNRVCIFELVSSAELVYFSGQSTAKPIYVGSAGKVLLAEMSDQDIYRLLHNIELRPLGPNTIIDLNQLIKELKKVRKKGYATSFGERIEGSASISVPIKNYICEAAISVLGPDSRMSRKMDSILNHMRASASRVSDKLSSGAN